MRHARHLRVTALLSLPLVGPLALAPAAQAAQTLTVCPKICSYNTIQAAVEAAKTGDKVEVRDGLLGYTGQVVLSKDITLEGDPNGPRPVIKPTGIDNGVVIESAAAGATVKHMAVSAVGTGIEVKASNVTVTDVTAVSTDGDAIVAAYPTSQVTIGPEVSATSLRDSPLVNAVLAEGQDLLTGVTATGTGRGGGADLVEATIVDSTITGGSSGTGLQLVDTAFPTHIPTAQRVLVTGQPAVLADEAVLTDSVVIGAESDAVRMDGGPRETLQLRNVTAVSSANGIEDPAGKGKIVGKNLIVRAAPGFTDLVADQLGGIEVGYSNFATYSLEVDTTGLGHNQLDQDPQFVDGTLGSSEDFHLRDSSPAAGAGTKDPQTGTTDLDGLPRPAIGASEPSMGAYEVTGHDLAVTVSGSGSVSAPGLACPGNCTNAYAVGSPVTLTATPAAGAVFEGWSGACSGVGSCEVTMSSEQSVSATFSVVAAVLGISGSTTTGSGTQKGNGAQSSSAPAPPSGARFVPSSFRAKKGTSLQLTLAEAATVNVLITQTQAGRKVAGRCKSSARHGARCSLTVQKAKLAFSGGLGSNRFKLLIPRLARGSYTATITATANGLSSTPAVLRFTVTTPKGR